MPLLSLTLNVEVPAGQLERVLDELTALVAQISAKPRRYVMVTIIQAALTLGGEPGPAAFVDVRGIGGFNPQVNSALCRQLCDYLEVNLNIPAARTYLTVTDIDACNWGWNRETFG